MDVNDTKLLIILSQIEEILIEKNKRYGNSALKPINVFYKGDATNSILIRLDDKVSRIKNSPTLRKNDLFDLLGYLYLYNISIDETKRWDFIERVNYVTSRIKLFRNGLVKTNEHPVDKSLFEQDFQSISDIDKNATSQEKDSVIMTLMNNIITYFIENDIVDFSDLID